MLAVLAGQGEPWPDGGGPVDKQPDGLVLGGVIGQADGCWLVRGWLVWGWLVWG